MSRARDVKFDQLDQEYYAVDSKAGYFYNVNETSNRIWELLASPLSVNTLCARLQQEYNVDPTRCLRDVTTILTQLREAGLVQVKDEAAA